MRRKFWILLCITIAIFALAACGDKEASTDDDNVEEELPALDVQFDVPETADLNETIELKATVTYDDEMVADADEVTFEVWEQDHEDDSTMIESENNGDGTYTAKTSFDKDGIYEMFAHTTARDQHTMPMKTVIAGDASAEESSTENASDGHHH
ncbi:FixH family protein [Oceanobacillus massiliensis]|uniref:FixH family protein n=1 Tax=Oceanobacillus massiliensis TaxID=1465765 RepID=UPI000287C6BC|nr:FixH family protein [Oceanobacillus massiliensis]